MVTDAVIKTAADHIRMLNEKHRAEIAFCIVLSGALGMIAGGWVIANYKRHKPQE